MSGEVAIGCIFQGRGFVHFNIFKSSFKFVFVYICIVYLYTLVERLQEVVFLVFNISNLSFNFYFHLSSLEKRFRLSFKFVFVYFCI